MKILPVEAEIFQADFRAYMTNLIVAHRNVVNTSKTVTFTFLGNKNDILELLSTCIF